MRIVTIAALLLVLIACQRTITSGSIDFLTIGESKQETLASAEQAGVLGVSPVVPGRSFVKLSEMRDSDRDYLLEHDVWEFPLLSGYGQYRVFFNQAGQLEKIEYAYSPVEL